MFTSRRRAEGPDKPTVESLTAFWQAANRLRGQVDEVDKVNVTMSTRDDEENEGMVVVSVETTIGGKGVVFSTDSITKGKAGAFAQSLKRQASSYRGFNFWEVESS